MLVSPYPVSEPGGVGYLSTLASPLDPAFFLMHAIFNKVYLRVRRTRYLFRAQVVFSAVVGVSEHVVMRGRRRKSTTTPVVTVLSRNGSRRALTSVEPHSLVLVGNVTGQRGYLSRGSPLEAATRTYGGVRYMTRMDTAQIVIPTIPGQGVRLVLL